jgi:hypothetical protein
LSSGVRFEINFLRKQKCKQFAKLVGVSNRRLPDSNLFNGILHTAIKSIFIRQ